MDENSSLENYTLYTQEIIQQILMAKKVAVIGNQGAGKTTLARKLAEIIGIDYLEEVEVKEILKIREKINHRDNWIVDGEFGLLDLVDVIIFLDFPLSLCLQRGMMRAWKNLATWNFSSIEVFLRIPKRILTLYSWIIQVCLYPSKKRSKVMNEINYSLPNKNMITLKNPQELELLLAALQKRE